MIYQEPWESDDTGNCSLLTAGQRWSITSSINDASVWALDTGHSSLAVEKQCKKNCCWLTNSYFVTNKYIFIITALETFTVSVLILNFININIINGLIVLILRIAEFESTVEDSSSSECLSMTFIFTQPLLRVCEIDGIWGAPSSAKITHNNSGRNEKLQWGCLLRQSDVVRQKHH